MTSRKKCLASIPPGALSSFTRTIRFPHTGYRYPELRELELRQLARVLLSFNPSPTLELLKTKIKSYGHGRLRHAKDILPTLYELMESDESVKEMPLPAAAPPNQQVAGGDWEGLTRALTSSLTTGMFLDSQVYAVKSRSSTGLPKIQPIYFCSTVGGSFTSMLVARKCPLGSHVSELLIHRSRFVENQSMESTTSSMCGWV